MEKQRGRRLQRLVEDDRSAARDDPDRDPEHAPLADIRRAFDPPYRGELQRPPSAEAAAPPTPRPAGVSARRTARRSRRSSRRRTRPLRTSRSHNLDAVDGVTASSSASAALLWGPREASTTNDRYCVNVTSSATSASDRAATATSTRLAVSTASTTGSCSDSRSSEDSFT